MYPVYLAIIWAVLLSAPLASPFVLYNEPVPALHRSNFKTIRKIGSGDYGAAFLARPVDQAGKPTEYVIKVFSAASDEDLDSYLRELNVYLDLLIRSGRNYFLVARGGASLGDQIYGKRKFSFPPLHPNLIHFHGPLAPRKRNDLERCILMERMDMDLDTYLQRQTSPLYPASLPPAGPLTSSQPFAPRPALPEAIIRDILRQLLSALQFMHHHDIVHADICAKNILLRLPSDPEAAPHSACAPSPPGRVKLCDLGSAIDLLDAARRPIFPRGHLLYVRLSSS
jgi:serine/threonine protein kinase